mmetsp:Transcript_18817/g.54208  ORF Transcript_18817/g.54208 Transcript_18817/m.54208 type:complete len:636 (-) Transcript_18817:1087-2994(-)
MMAAAEPHSHGDDSPSYDLVIVGAGPSACGLLYGLLRRHIFSSKQHEETAQPQPLPFTVALLDRGTTSASSSPSAHRTNPSDWFRASHGGHGINDDDHGSTRPRSPSLLQTKPQTGLGNRIVEVPIGDGLGGSTNINACLVATPSQHNFDDWPDNFSGSKMMGAANHIAGVMKRNDAIELTNFSTGSASDDPSASVSSLDPAQFPSKVVGQVATSSRRLKGTNHHVRVNYFDALIRPLLDEYPYLRQHVTFLEGFDVQRILFEKEDCGGGSNIACRATGVECNVITGKRVQIRARKELVLCAGAILSTALLMVSGIGPQDVISDQGIRRPDSITTPPPEWNVVGRGLTDHVVLPRAFFTLPRKWRSRSISGIQCWFNTKDDQSLYQLAITDGMCSAQLIPHFVAAFFRRQRRFLRLSSVELMNQHEAWDAIVDSAWSAAFRIVRWILHLLLVWTPLSLIVKHCTATINISLLNPVSKGCVVIRRRTNGYPESASPRLEEFDIIVDPGYLSDVRDMKAVEQGWTLSESVRKEHFDECLEVLPSFFYRRVFPFAERKDWIFQFASDFACPYFHWNGTCAMSDDSTDASIVNDRLQVSGIKGLYVCDASVFPSNVSCPPALTCASLGYVASEYIRSAL